MTAILHVDNLGKRYRSHWALAECTLSVPAGSVTGLVGPNGAGKTTFLQLATGLLRPTTGTVTVAGGRPADGGAQLAKVGFVAQDAPTYAAMSVADHLRLGAKLNPRWDAQYARGRVERLGLEPRRHAGKLSGGQRAQLALTLAVAKRPELLVLDEPVASLDPLARKEFLDALADAAHTRGMSVVLSSHLVADLQAICDGLIVLSGGRLQVAGAVGALLTNHRVLTGPRDGLPALPTGSRRISAHRTDRETIIVARFEHAAPVPDPGWTMTSPSLEQLVLAYLAERAPERQEVRA